MALTKAADPRYRRRRQGMEPLPTGSFTWGNQCVDGEFGRTLAAGHKFIRKRTKSKSTFFSRLQWQAHL